MRRRPRPARAMATPMIPEASVTVPPPVGGSSNGVAVVGGVGGAAGGVTCTDAAVRSSASAGKVVTWARGPLPKPVAVSVVSAVGWVVTTQVQCSPTSSTWLPLVSPVKPAVVTSTDMKLVAPPSTDRSTCTDDSAAGKNRGGVSLVSVIVQATDWPAWRVGGLAVTVMAVDGARKNVGASAVASTVPSSFCGGGPLATPS